MRPADLVLQFTCWPGTALAAFACNRLSWDCLGGHEQYPQEHQVLDVVSVLGDSMLAPLHCRHAVTFYTAYSQFASSARCSRWDCDANVRKLCQDCMSTTSAICHAD